jgi:hypothetical protein
MTEALRLRPAGCGGTGRECGLPGRVIHQEYRQVPSLECANVKNSMCAQ